MSTAIISSRHIMPNKGEYLADALAVLDSVVVRMQNHQSKKVSKFRALRR